MLQVSAQKLATTSLRGPARLRSALVILLLLAVFAGGVASEAQVPNAEAQRRAAFVRKILNFVEWPARETGRGRDAFQFCAVGDRFFLFTLTQQMAGTSVGDRRVQVRWVEKDADLNACDAVYMPGSSREAFGKWLPKLNRPGVLTFGEASGFLTAGGMLQLDSSRDGVRFDVNLRAVRDAGLHIDSRLLELAMHVTMENGRRGD